MNTDLNNNDISILNVCNSNQADYQTYEINVVYYDKIGIMIINIIHKNEFLTKEKGIFVF